MDSLAALQREQPVIGDLRMPAHRHGAAIRLSGDRVRECQHCVGILTNVTLPYRSGPPTTGAPAPGWLKSTLCSRN